MPPTPPEQEWDIDEDGNPVPRPPTQTGQGTGVGGYPGRIRHIRGADGNTYSYDTVTDTYSLAKGMPIATPRAPAGTPIDLGGGQYRIGDRLARRGPPTYSALPYFDPGISGDPGFEVEKPGPFVFESTERAGGDWRVSGGFLVNQRTGQVQRLTEPAGRQRFASEEERDLAAAAENRANAAYLQARTSGLTEDRAIEVAKNAQTQAYQEATTQLGRDRLLEEGRQFNIRQALDQQQADTAGRVAFGNIDVSRGRLGVEQGTLAQQVNRENAAAALGISRLELDRMVGTGQLDLNSRELQERVRQFNATQGLAEARSRGGFTDRPRIVSDQGDLVRVQLPDGTQRVFSKSNVDDQRALQDLLATSTTTATLEAELGRRAASLGEQRLGLDTSRFGLDTELGRAAEARQGAQLYGFGEGGPTLEAQRLAGVLRGGTPTLEKRFGEAGLIGTLDGQETLAGRQQAESETAAAFARLASPVATGAMRSLVDQGILTPQALATGRIPQIPQGQASLPAFGSSPVDISSPLTSAGLTAFSGSPRIGVQTINTLTPGQAGVLKGYSETLTKQPWEDTVEESRRAAASLGPRMAPRGRVSSF